MADKKISALTSLAQGDVAASTDVLPIVDTSATETKKITASALVGAGMTAGVTNVDINSGAIDGTTIGANSAAAGTFTNLTASGTVSFSGATVSNGGTVATIDINGGTIDATTIGASSASTGAFTTLSASSTVSGTGFSTYLASPPAIGGTTAAAGSFTTLTTSSTVTLSGGTANGVLYLNGSKVATSGSALVFDGTNLGIGVSPSYRLDILASGSAAGLRINNATAGKSAMLLQTNGTTAGIIGLTGFILGDSSTNLGLFAETGYDIRLYTNGSPTLKAVLDTSGNLGIGTASPGAKLHVLGSNFVGIFAGTNANTVYTEYRYNSTTTSGFIGNGSSILSAAADSDFIVRSEGALKFATNGNNFRATLDSSGNLGLGVTPAAGVRFDVRNDSTTTLADMRNANASGYGIYIAAGSSSSQYVQRWADYNNNALATLDASGNLGLGTTSPVSALHIQRGASAAAYYAAAANNATLATSGFLIGQDAAGLSRIYQYGSNPMTFWINDTERGRFTAGGYFKASDAGTYVNSTGTYHELRNTANETACLMSCSNTGFTSSVLALTAYPVSGTGFKHLICRSDNGNDEVMNIRGDGNLYNDNGVYGSISDARLKQDIVDAPSQWDDLKAVRFRKYRFKADVEKDSNAPALFGVVAQELEQVCPGLVDDGEIKTVKSSILLMKAAKALQEAMARIESLEADVAALKGAK